jgi:hypothetical protein
LDGLTHREESSIKDAEGLKDACEADES